MGLFLVMWGCLMMGGVFMLLVDAFVMDTLLGRQPEGAAKRMIVAAVLGVIIWAVGITIM